MIYYYTSPLFTAMPMCVRYDHERMNELTHRHMNDRRWHTYEPNNKYESVHYLCMFMCGGNHCVHSYFVFANMRAHAHILCVIPNTHGRRGCEHECDTYSVAFWSVGWSLSHRECVVGITQGMCACVRAHWQI